jgi:phosphotriesterase-related protein
MAKCLQTVTGPVDAAALGLILPHEHLFTDLRGPTVPGYAQADPEKVVNLLAPYLAAASAAGVTALVECSTVGVGRNLTVLRRLAESTPIRILAPSGVYREAYTPEELRTTGLQELAELWEGELTEGMERTPVRAGFLKLAMSEDGPTELEIRNLKAAARASLSTGAVIASHTVGGGVAKQEMDILESEGLDLHRFIWVHAQTEPDLSVLLAAARRGAYLEIDSVGGTWQPREQLLKITLALVDAGYEEQLLLSHDSGWYNPARADGLPEEGFRGYTALITEFIPALKARGLTDEQVKRLTVTNPAQAFAF